MNEQHATLEATLETALKTLAETPRKKSNTRMIYELLPGIEASFKAGATYAEVRKTLAENGLELSARAFESALFRARGKE
jgi:hypothetical protein